MTATATDALVARSEACAAEIRLAVMAAELVIDWHREDYGVCRNHDGHGEVIAIIEPVSGEWRAARGCHIRRFDTKKDAERAVLRGVFGW